MAVVLITGAASGLGWALAQACHARGDQLLLSDINANAVHARAAALGANAVALAGDICTTHTQQALLNACREHFGRLDVLINNAGITHRSPTTLTQPHVLRQVMAVDYHAPLELSIAALALLQQSAGKIICIGSMAGWMPLLGRAGYCAAKSAMSQAFEVLRAELAQAHIDLLMVYPSFIDTPIEQHALGVDGLPAAHRRSTLGPISTAQEIAKQILQAAEKRQPRLFPDRFSYLASLLWRLAPNTYYRLMQRRFAAELP